jgi:hypothetical protein
MPPSSKLSIPDLSNCFDFRMMEDFASTILETAITNILDGKNYNASNVPSQVSSMNKVRSGRVGAKER